MGRFIRGDVVVVPYPFTRQNAGKVRPALVLAAPVNNEVILCALTSSLYNDGYSMLISSEDFGVGRLKHDSYARLPNLFTCEDDVIMGMAGQLKTDKMAEIVRRIIAILNN